MSTTCWLDSKETDLDKVIKNLIDYSVIEDKETSSIFCTNWYNTKVFDDIKSIKLNGREVKYNMIKCDYDEVTVGNRPIEERTVHKSFFVIVYYNGSSVNYIINRKSDAKRMLRKVLKYTGKSEIQQNEYYFSNDLLVWLISKVYTFDNIIESDNDKNLQLETIKGLKGDTKDSQTKVSATGESVMNIISTLSFLLESGKLNQIMIELNYTSHEKISLIIRNDCIDIDFRPYLGAFDSEDKDSIISKLYLLVYLEILPIIEQEFRKDISEDKWNKERYIDFMNQVAQNLREKLEEKIESLNQE